MRSAGARSINAADLSWGEPETGETVLVLEPIFEADLQPEQHAYRQGHDAHQAVREVHGWLRRGLREVVDADLSGYLMLRAPALRTLRAAFGSLSRPFPRARLDTIPHPELMKSLERRISDGSMLELLKSWLQMPVEENVLRVTIIARDF